VRFLVASSFRPGRPPRRYKVRAQKDNSAEGRCLHHGTSAFINLSLKDGIDGPKNVDFLAERALDFAGHGGDYILTPSQ